MGNYFLDIYYIFYMITEGSENRIYTRISTYLLIFCFGPITIRPKIATLSSLIWYKRALNGVNKVL